MSIRHGHSSSRYDRSPKTLAEEVGRATSSDRDGNLLTFTEVGDPDRAAKLAADGWGRFVPHGKTDCGIMWELAEFDKITSDVHRVTGKTWTDGQGHTHHQDATTVVLEHESGYRLWVSVMHLPSGVQDGCNFDGDTAQVRAWQAALPGWADYHHEHKNDFHCDQSMYVADWNVDFRKQCWREHVGHVYPNCKGTWRNGNLPADGTHGDRLIDATWTDGKFQSVALLPDDDSSDHRPYGEAIGWQ